MDSLPLDVTTKNTHEFTIRTDDSLLVIKHVHNHKRLSITIHTGAGSALDACCSKEFILTKKEVEILKLVIRGDE